MKHMFSENNNKTVSKRCFLNVIATLILPIFKSTLFVALALLLILLNTSNAADRQPADITTAISKVARQNIPAVVHIEVTEKQEVSNPLLPFESDPFFQRFFGNPKMPKKFKRDVKGLGSGMIIDELGHILTNHHVAGGATKIEVFLSDGRKYNARLVGTDPKTDLAVISINAKEKLPHVTFGDSDKLEVGEWVVAIGHPRGLDQTVTQGIISAKHRQGISDPSGYQDFLQTDAAINPGNSGGPLLNLYGEVVGVNAAIASESGGFEGIGFTIPGNMALHIARTLIAHGKVDRGWLGVSVQDVTPEIGRAERLGSHKGAYIADVVKGGPADRAGVKKGDVVTSYAGKDILESGVFRNEVANTSVGQQVKISVTRQGTKIDLVANIGSLDESIKATAGIVKNRLGAEVKSLTVQQSEKYGLSPNQGVVITWLDAKGPLKIAGFELGDIVLGINNQPVEGLEAIVTLAGYLKPGQKIAIMALDHNTGDTGMVQVVVR